LSQALGGSQTAAVCVGAGWTLGKVKDIYMSMCIDNGAVTNLWEEIWSYYLC